MKTTLSLFALLACTAITPFAHAQPTEVLRLMDEAIASTPATAIAQADIARASATRDRLNAGPYEIEVGITGGHRTVEDPLLPDLGYTEWSLDVSRTLRLPEKQRLDSALGKVELDLARSGQAATQLEERLVFADLWSDWSRWTATLAGSSGLAESAWQLARLEQQKVDAGAGRQLQADLLKAEAQTAQLAADADRLQTESARAALAQRYPSLALPQAPVAIDINTAEIDRLMTQDFRNNTLSRPAELAAERARLLARRAAAERRPDPTIGLGLSNEFGGDETAIMASVSIPIGGRARRSRVNEAQAAVQGAEAEHRQLQWLLTQKVSDARYRLRHAETLLSEAESANATARAALQRLETGFSLGEVRIGDLIATRRTVLETARLVAEQQAARERAYLELLVLSQPS